MASATATAAFTANSRHIAQFEAKPYPQQLDESTVTEAFGHLAYPKIVSVATREGIPALVQPQQFWQPQRL